MKIKLMLIILFSCSTVVFADPLPLTPLQMQKLSAYFPQEKPGNVIWNGDPIKIVLPIGKEKRLIFPSSVTPEVNRQLTADQLRLMNDDKSLYLTALQAFDTTRINVKVNATGEVILMDISTRAQASSAPLAVIVQQDNAPDENITSALVRSSDNSPPVSSSNDSAVTLIRYAWQQLYAPERLLKESSETFPRVPMHVALFLPHLFYGAKVLAHPLASWENNGTTVTAVELRNQYAHATKINLTEDLCGDWVAATLYPTGKLKPAGVKTGDTAVLFLVSAQAFTDSIQVCNGHA